MKKISVLLALMALFFADLVFAGAVATHITGTVTAQTGTAAARTVRQGDELNQGDTVSTGAASSVVLRFDDGQVAALTSNSRMTITAYQYNPTAKSGNVLLSLINGGMRAITGLIGRNNPSQVSYRAATATIGIRGTDITILTDGGNIVVTVTDGEISFTFGAHKVTVKAGQGVNARTDGTFRQEATDQILSQLTDAEFAMLQDVLILEIAIHDAAIGETQSFDLRTLRPLPPPTLPGGGVSNH